jgi:hypothetical protein
VALRPRRQLIALAASVLCLTALVALPAAEAASRPDLKVTDGSVTTNGLGDRISGRFTVRNAGGSAARSSTAYVKIRQGSRYRYLTELRILRLPARNNDRYEFRTETPSWLGPGGHAVRVCLDVKDKVGESREGNNCRGLGGISVVNDGAFAYPRGRKWFVPGYYGWVPEGYDDTHATPSALFVWLHGCGGQSRYDIVTYHPDTDDDYVMIAPTGAEGGCWNTPSSGAGDDGIVLAAIADARKRFEIDPGRIVLGGYSSGGDLSYRVAYRNSTLIDGVLAANTAPFRDTGVSPAQGTDPGVTRFRVVHLAHSEDDVYPIQTVHDELDVLVANSFLVERFVLPGQHYDAATDGDIRTYLLPRVDP